MSFYSHAQIPRYKGQGKKKTSGRKAGAKVTRGRPRRAAGRADPALAPPRTLSFCWPGVKFCLEMSLSFICDQNMLKSW